MAQNKIEILSDNLANKKRQLVYYNYLGYADLPFKEKKILKKQIFSEMKRKSLKIVYHS
jgi:hypothetical protein